MPGPRPRTPHKFRSVLAPPAPRACPAALRIGDCDCSLSARTAEESALAHRGSGGANSSAPQPLPRPCVGMPPRRGAFSFLWVQPFSPLPSRAATLQARHHRLLRCRRHRRRLRHVGSHEQRLALGDRCPKVGLAIGALSKALSPVYSCSAWTSSSVYSRWLGQATPFISTSNAGRDAVAS